MPAASADLAKSSGNIAILSKEHALDCQGDTILPLEALCLIS